MQVAPRSRLTVGLALAAASVVAVNPLTVPTSVPSPPAVSSAAVQLAASYNPLQPWLEAFQTASASATQIGDTFSQAPAVLLQQILANQAGYLSEVLKNPGSIGTVLGQMVANVQAAFTAATLLGIDATINPFPSQESLDGWHSILLQSIPKLLRAGTPPQAVAVVKELLNVLSSPVSGIVFGFAGPVISPVVAVVNSVHNIVSALVAGDFATAMQGVINIPADIVGAVLNGANLNLDGLVPVLNNAGLLSPGTTLHNLNIQFGGLFSPGSTGVDPMTGEPVGIGGSIFNSIGMTTTTDLMGFPLTLEIPGIGIGPIGALVAFGQIIAKAIGWSGVGNPLAELSKAPAADTAPATTLVTKTALTNDSPAAIPSTSAATFNISSGGTAFESPLKTTEAAAGTPVAATPDETGAADESTSDPTADDDDANDGTEVTDADASDAYTDAEEAADADEADSADTDTDTDTDTDIDTTSKTTGAGEGSTDSGDGTDSVSGSQE
ncbi:outer membrane porin GjpA [Mycolicibacterium holsaticum]|uniref:outer membrane porin GjpA n=1 Tax=Mycolicibacterium holsaticum TaxID=152142 RepID=UPI001C7CF135|nr:outer membrane porin GjpA [Mycolicibacterium holsaticum]MDA4108308.1 hypothetical protein [Mycolicibacterium holsaticum DSM 44478 = JCM 12374]QZA12924.1 outer membrane porin GjpA [Mycolicibacterium holsaticum DSM 44478 = JCM 12374]UNC09602.1 outer membrane porin GjpA [Mycolicibacterium holsaticum DSM 44478 = JCM 12374]